MREPGSPPRWAEAVLEVLLPADDRHTLTGDLREEYAEAVLPASGRRRADLWYLRQVAALAPRCIIKEGKMRKILLLASVFSVACGAWLVTMELLLHHAGYAARAAMDAVISLIPLATVLAILLHVEVGAERWFRLLGLPLIAIGLWAFVRNARSAHFEGFVLIVSLVLAAQGALMLAALGRGVGTSTRSRMEGSR